MMITSFDSLIEFLKRYHAPRLLADPPQPLSKTKLPIPPSLQRLYDTFGHQIIEAWGPLSSQDHLQPPSRLKLGGDYVLFLDENQGCWTCGYSVEPPHQKLWLSGGPNGDILSTTLDEFLITFALFEAVMSSPFFLGSEEIDSHTKLRLPFTPLRHASLYVWDEPVEFWISEDERTIYYAHCGFGWLGSYSEESIRACHPTGAEGEKFDFDPWAPATYVGGKATRFQHKRPYVFPYSFGIWTGLSTFRRLEAV